MEGDSKISIDLRQTRLINNNIFFVIPSWGDLIGYPTLGKYVNHYVSKINSDLVIFLAGLESTINVEISTEFGNELRALHYLFGLGYYYSKFELQSGRYIIDNRQLTGLILSDFVYDHLATSKNITLENDRDIIIASNVFKLPINLSHKSVTQKSFIKGALMRNLFIPYKDVVLEMMETVRDPASYQLRNGHILLSTHWDYYNKILISSIMREGIKIKFMNPTAGINDVILGSDQHLNEIFTNSELEKINEKISSLKEIYSNLDYDLMYLFSIIENASKKLISEPTQILRDEARSVSEKRTKESVLISAKSRINSFIKWPDEFKRNTKEELELSAIYKEFIEHPPVIKTTKFEMKISEEIPKIEKQRINNIEKFEIRTLKRPIVESKLLPKPPKGNVLKILYYLKELIEQNYDILSIGKALEFARDNLRKIILQSKFMWEMGKFVNLYQREQPNLGFSQKERYEFLEKIDLWIKDAIKHKDDLIKKN
jgi:hypothetical protein